MASALAQSTLQAPAMRLAAMTPETRRLAYEEGELTRAELFAWAALFPEEVPLIDGELPWIVATLADLD
jgi:hypothetical protein